MGGLLLASNGSIVKNLKMNRTTAITKMSMLLRFTNPGLLHCSKYSILHYPKIKFYVLNYSKAKMKLVKNTTEHICNKSHRAFEKPTHFTLFFKIQHTFFLIFKILFFKLTYITLNFFVCE